jgi:hypothetical protein
VVLTGVLWLLGVGDGTGGDTKVHMGGRGWTLDSL